MTIRRKTLQGLETEFGFSALDQLGRRCDIRALEKIFAAVRARVPVMSSDGNGFFLANGGLLYVDTGNHLEWATPECTSPREVVRYQRAGERLIAGAAQQVEATTGFSQIRIFKTNVCYASPHSSFGSHESCLYRNFPEALARQLLPFLASRIIFTGAGGLVGRHNGIAFSLSPRVAHLEQQVSGGTTNARGIFNTKNESLSENIYRRLHLICGESNCSQFQTWLRLGTTALVVAMVDAGLVPGQAVQLEDALSAMRHFASDRSARAPLADERHPRGITAIDIQYHYLSMAEQHLASLFMPEWAAEICAAWRETLEALAADPMSLADRLDWPLKYCLIQDRLEKQVVGGLPVVALWNSVLANVENTLTEDERHEFFPLDYARIKSRGRKHDALGAAIRAGTKRLAERKIRWRQLDEFMRLRWELCEFDMSFGQISPGGIFAALDREGVLNHRLWNEEECETAIACAPDAGRAKIRGDEIKRLAGDGPSYNVCNWAGLLVGGSYMNLSDPFVASARWVDYSRAKTAGCDDANAPHFLRRRLRRLRGSR